MKNKITVLKCEQFSYMEVVDESIRMWVGGSVFRQTVCQYGDFAEPIHFDYEFYILPKTENIRYAYEQEFYLEKIPIRDVTYEK